MDRSSILASQLISSPSFESSSSRSTKTTKSSIHRAPSSYSEFNYSDRSSSPSSSSSSPKMLKRAVIVDGCRTPFIRSFGAFLNVDSIQLGTAAVAGLIKKTNLDPNLIDEVIWGNVVLTTTAPNIAREIVLDLNLPRKIPGTSVSKACLSSLETVLQAVRLIETGNAECVIAGGSDSTSNGEMPMPREFTRALAKLAFSRKKGIKQIAQFFKTAGGPGKWMPQRPAVAERSTGKTMGYHADLMAEINHVTRAEQDKFAMGSHIKAAKARKSGWLANDIVPITVGKTTVFQDDNLREKQDAKKMAKLRPAFRKKPKGTVTAATSSPLTDGGAAILVMSEDLAKKLGYPIDVSFSSYAFAAIEPYPQLLLAPAIAIPKCLNKAGLTLDEIDAFEIHEAFAAQVLATKNCLESPEFSRKYLHSKEIVGKLDLKKVNLNGSSIAYGHPFAAKGAHLVLESLKLIRQKGKKNVLISVCAAGGLGGVAILEKTT